MSPEAWGYISMVALFVLLFLRVPVGYTLAFVGFLAYLGAAGSSAALRMAGLIIYSKVVTYEFTVIPLFILMGQFAFYGGLAGKLFNAGKAWFGRFPGGLVQATIAGATAFGACCGAGIASCATVSRVTIPEMLKAGVSRKLAFGAVAAAGTIAQMIPPSNLMVIYGIISEQSIAKLLIAGILPGIVHGINFMVFVYIIAKRNPTLAPLAEEISWKDRFTSVKDTWPVALLFIAMVGGIYAGIFTPTEAGAVGAFGAFLLSIAGRNLNRRNLWDCIYEAGKTTSQIMFLIGCAFLFGYLISISRIPYQVSEFLVSAPVSRYVILAGIMLMYIILGCFLDMIAALFITLPVILPAVGQLGFDYIWFGVLIVHLVEMALITPPFGLNLFTLQGIFPDASMKEIISGVFPFILVDTWILALFIAFPQIALFLPNLMWK